MPIEITSELKSFADTARSFCAWCEGASLGAEPEVAAAAWMSRLNAAALALPDVGYENANDLPELAGSAYENAKRNLAPFWGRYYREFFDPDPMIEDAWGLGDIGDDLTDVYLDIRRGLLVFDQGETGEALWYWSCMHRAHWGRHAIGAIYALHCLSISKRRGGL